MYQRHQGESGEEEADTQLWQRDTGCGVQQKHLTSFFFSDAAKVISVLVVCASISTYFNRAGRVLCLEDV